MNSQCLLDGAVGRGQTTRMQSDLTIIHGDLAGRLAEGSKNRRSPMHVPVVATADADARVMVLRDFDANSWTLRFHTDARSPKCAVVGDRAPIGLLFYDPPEKVQIRLRGTGRIEREGPIADAAWTESTNFARRCYLGEGPGAVSDTPTSGLPDWAEGIEPNDSQLMQARANFAVLLVEIAHADWFHLSNDGHRRAQFDRGIDGKWDGRWVAP